MDTADIWRLSTAPLPSGSHRSRADTCYGLLPVCLDLVLVRSASFSLPSVKKYQNPLFSIVFRYRIPLVVPSRQMILVDFGMNPNARNQVVPSGLENPVFIRISALASPDSFCFGIKRTFGIHIASLRPFILPSERFYAPFGIFPCIRFPVSSLSRSEPLLCCPCSSPGSLGILSGSSPLFYPFRSGIWFLFLLGPACAGSAFINWYGKLYIYCGNFPTTPLLENGGH